MCADCAGARPPVSAPLPAAGGGRWGEARIAAGAAADDAALVLVPALAALDAVVLGGDRRAVEALRSDPRLTGVFALAGGRFVATREPRQAVLLATPARFRATRI